MVADARTGRFSEIPAYWTYIPRRDQPERYDEQESFYHEQIPGVSWIIGGNGSGTTTTAIAKAIKFILETPAPRRDTPFWFIAETYEQVCNLFDEKISNLGHLPDHLIEWKRIFWKNRNNNWPLRVPLKSHQGRRGKNWVLEFKSWKQGRGQMQARSIGGFLFMEQFPWKVFEEVVRGCREYNFPGAKLVEYTPVDPDLSIEIEEMLENGYEPADSAQRQKGARYMPKDWKVYHCNTACAMEQGHVDKAWFEEFFGMIPEDMLDVRMKGLFASFEGTIYKEFEAKTHCVGDEAWKYLQDAHWIRGIDWGGGPENAFACYRPDTEVLTENGWKLIGDVELTERVATMNMETENIEFQHPTHKHSRPWNGDLVVFDGKVGCAVTTDHQMVIKRHRSNKVLKKPAIEVYGMRSESFMTSTNGVVGGDTSQVEIPHVYGCKKMSPVGLVEFARFLGLYLAEGNMSRFKTNSLVRIVQKDHVPAVRAVMDSLGWRYHVYVNPKSGMHEFTISSTALFEYLMTIGAGGKSREKRVPRVVYSWSKEAKLAFLDGYHLGDGRKNFEDDGVRYSSKSIATSSSGMADDLQELCFHVGITSSIKKQDRRSGFNNQPFTMYTVSLQTSRQCSINGLSRRLEHYTGDVQCLTVPNGTLVVRQKGKAPFVCGNCVLVAITPDGTAYVMDEYYSFDQNCTTIDHLVNIQDQMPWLLDNPNYGMTYADPADPDNFRIASKLSQYAKSHRGVDIQNMPMARAKNAVFEGIEHIRMMLKPSRLKAVLNRDTNMLEEKKFPRLFIHRGNCPNLIRELKTYRWQKSADPTGKGIINPRAAKRAPAKFNDHACFTPDTLVQAGFKTIKPISEVKVGETVVGRNKRSRVLAGWTVTRRNVEILELTFKHTGEKIKCTPDHRLWFWGQWVRADLLKDDHDIFSSWTSYVVPEVGCIATQNGNFKLACGIVAKNCDALRYALATHYQAMGMTIESARLSKPRAGAPESVRDSGKRYSSVTEMHRGG